ncbi:hypothetical protein ISN45_Aa05g000050 [Arabidopsis thaliana x Arabidopsis arenosa]|uniref:Uncharacterized protein n=1 Tax=Arabidopsis thaliana x Arabidopsis arenosa TaxID=1240361 RepID=A0A8T1ZGF4_9BRAS|nr:hypothetical protein ISN45_Aa05g000050 [Arabidopsis thaliana x Arabidopsis arenosa]
MVLLLISLIRLQCESGWPGIHLMVPEYAKAVSEYLLGQYATEGTRDYSFWITYLKIGDQFPPSTIHEPFFWKGLPPVYLVIHRETFSQVTTKSLQPLPTNHNFTRVPICSDRNGN